ncbi:hypothetical protein PybrP1_012985 [[Pythium] brassicae (nom. inval.)]|nr:hypothetical protein PybrP1_012985 [[Pythium] brassicae (nom. inval.)]
MTNAAAAQQSTLGAAGARVYSLALRSVHETKDSDLKRKLAKMVDRSLSRPVAAPTRAKLKHLEAVGDAIAASDMWDAAQPDEVQGLVHWLLEVTKSVNRLVLAGSLSVCRGILILIMNLPGVSTACTLLYRIFQLVDDTLGLTANDALDVSPHRSHVRQKKLESYMDDPSLTAVVLEYREKECMVPMSINRRIQRVMHFQIPLRSFEATVRLPPESAPQSRRLDRPGRGTGGAVAPGGEDEASSTSAYVSSSSPRSIPVSPIARKRVQLAFSNFSDDVLYQARDRLRQERAATLTGERLLHVPRFNVQDCNEEIYLSCGKHCATKVGPGMYRSVRATVPIPKHRFTYFEMTVNQPKSPFRIPSRASRNLLEAVCIGLSTRSMPLNTLVGASKYSIGFYSVGHVLVGSEHRSFVAVSPGFDYEATVGVLVKVVDRTDVSGDDAQWRQRDGTCDGGAGVQASALQASGCSTLALVRFSVNGAALRDETNRVMEFVLAFPPNAELFPTLTLHSQDVQVLSRFSAADITAPSFEDFDLKPDSGSSKGDAEVWCLDGLRLEAPC